MHKILVHAQHSCACTTLLCMHWRGQGPRPGPNKKAAAPGPRPLQCIHKSVVHAQECCACTRILCTHKNLDKQDVPRLTNTYQRKVGKLVTNVKILVHAQHNTLVHALEGLGTKAGTQQKSSRGSAPENVLCMHKNLVHAQESCA